MLNYLATKLLTRDLVSKQKKQVTVNPYFPHLSRCGFSSTIYSVCNGNCGTCKTRFQLSDENMSISFHLIKTYFFPPVTLICSLLIQNQKYTLLHKCHLSHPFKDNSQIHFIKLTTKLVLPLILSFIFKAGYVLINI